MEYFCTMVVQSPSGQTKTVHTVLNRPEPGPDWGPSYVAQMAANPHDVGVNRVVEFHYSISFQPITEEQVESELRDLDLALKGLS